VNRLFERKDKRPVFGDVVRCLAEVLGNLRQYVSLNVLYLRPCAGRPRITPGRAIAIYNNFS